MKYETELYIHNKHVTEYIYIYKLWLRFDMEEQVNDCMVKWAKNFGYNMQIEQCKVKWIEIYIV